MFFWVVGLMLQSCIFIEPSQAKGLPEKYKYDNEENALFEIKTNHNMQVFVLGNVNIPEFLSQDLLITQVTEEDLDNNSIDKMIDKEIKTLFIDKNYSSTYLNDKQFVKLDNLLDEGFSVYLLGDNDINKFLSLTNNTPNKQVQISEEINYFPAFEGLSDEYVSQVQESTNILGYMWVSKNAKGEYLSGTRHFDSTFSQEDIVNKAIVGAWHRQEDNKCTYIISNDKVQENLAQKFANIAVAASLDDFEVGDGWQTWGWTRSDYTCEFGDLSVWYTWADLWQNGEPYLAFVGQSYHDPIDDHQNWGLVYGGDMDYYVDYPNQLREYGPGVSPSTTTWSYGIGGSLSGTVGGQSGLSGSIGANWNIGMTGDECDIFIADDTSMSSELCQVGINYKNYYTINPLVHRDYVIQTSRQDFTIIAKAYRDADGKTRIPIYHYAYFHELGTDSYPSRSAGAYRGFTLIYYPN